MDDQLSLPVRYKGQDLDLPVQLVVFGYSHRFHIQIGENEILFEMDDHGEYRALISNPDEQKQKLPEAGLLEAIAETLALLPASL